MPVLDGRAMPCVQRWIRKSIVVSRFRRLDGFREFVLLVWSSNDETESTRARLTSVPFLDVSLE